MTPFSPELIAFAAQLPAPLYAVGGCVRDALLGRASHDVDLGSAMTPERMQAFCEVRGVPCRVTNARLGTVRITLGSGQYEHTTFRTESYGAGGAHRPERVAFTDSLEADAFRRDFSINALYRNVLTGKIEDPTGGLKDLNRRVIRTTTEDPAAILRDDGLRLMRLARFAADTGFAIDERTRDAAVAYAALLDDIAPERKRQELDRILSLPDAKRGLMLLHTLGTLFRLFPCLAPCEGHAQRSDYHRYDVLTHSIETAGFMPPEAPLRLMGLLHDVGKPAALEADGHYHRHAELGAAIAEDTLRKLTYPNATIRRVAAAIAGHMFDLDGTAKESTLRVRFAQWGKDGVRDLILLREADIRGSGYDTAYAAGRWRRVFDAMQSDGCPWSESELAITGGEIMDALHLPPGKEVAALKKRLLTHCVRRPKDNTKDRLLRLLKDYGKLV